MLRNVLFVLMVMVISGFDSGVASARQSKKMSKTPIQATEELSPGFSVKASEVQLPQGVGPGHYIRSFQPFRRWTLICDDNLQQKTRVCNISQAILDPKGNEIYSWSLAASRGGRPVFIIRTPPGLGPRGSIVLDLPSGKTLVAVRMRGCSPKFCIAYLKVSDLLNNSIKKGDTLSVTYVLADSKKLPAFKVPLGDLYSALKAI